MESSASSTASCPPSADFAHFLTGRAMNSVLRGEAQAYSEIEEQILSNCRQDAIYHCCDRLTHFDFVPTDVYSGCTVAAFFELFESDFTLLSSTRDTKYSLPYDATTLPVWGCLERGEVSKELFCLLAKMGSVPFTCAKIVVSVTDFRLPSASEQRVLLKPGRDLLRYLLRDCDAEAERQLLLLLYPTVCTDPSPCVSRLSHLLDRRAHPWALRSSPAAPPEHSPSAPTPEPHAQSFDDTLLIGDSLRNLFRSSAPL